MANAVIATHFQRPNMSALLGGSAHDLSLVANAGRHYMAPGQGSTKRVAAGVIRVQPPQNKIRAFIITTKAFAGTSQQYSVSMRYVDQDTQAIVSLNLGNFRLALVSKAGMYEGPEAYDLPLSVGDTITLLITHDLGVGPNVLGITTIVQVY